MSALLLFNARGQKEFKENDRKNYFGMILECGRFVNGGISSIKILFDVRPGRIQTKMIEKRSYFEMILERVQILSRAL